ncbi:CrcB-like protein, Camphor Resistance (CrcB) [Treponema bryantii]|uniref:Fluoride-specific ion channel n=1 Tax=Treponema bryantii TaxID=163 RepID=A0A1H9IP33_9SPIR|nr:CrcB-like protein, Camphor Resistance (CrcB) [Treponema bryantii]
MIDCLAVALGGAIGSVLRYLIGLLPLKEQTLFPIKTFAINVLDCFIIGLIAAFSL